MFDTTGSPLKNGFDHFFGYNCQRHAHDYYTRYLYRDDQRIPLDGKTYSADVIAQEALAFIQQNKDRPFFLYFATTLPHGDFVIPSAAPYDKQPWPKIVQNYAAMIAKLDAEVGQTLALLKDLNLDQRTLVIFSSDNGPNPEFINDLQSAGGLRGIKRTLYEGGIRAPMVARWPGHIAPASTCDTPVCHIDFLPTAAELTGASIPKPVDGISLLPALTTRGTLARRDYLYFEIHEPRFQQAVRLGNWKACRNGTKAPLELYDLKSDPAEQHNIADAHADIIKQIESIMLKEHT